MKLITRAAIVLAGGALAASVGLASTAFSAPMPMPNLPDRACVMQFDDAADDPGIIDIAAKKKPPGAKKKGKGKRKG